MVKLERNENNICDSCMESNAYEILAQRSEQHIRKVCLCKTCMDKIVDFFESESNIERLEWELEEIARGARIIKGVE